MESGQAEEEAARAARGVWAEATTSSAQEAQLVSRREHVARTRGEDTWRGHVAGARRKGTQRGRAEWHAARARDEGTRRGYTERCHVARTRGSRYSAESGQAEEENGKGGGRSAGRGHHGAQRRKRSSCHARKTERRRGGGWRRPKELGVGRSRHGARRRERSSCHTQHSGAEAHAAKNAQVLRAQAGRKKRGRGAGGGRSS